MGLKKRRRLSDRTNGRQFAACCRISTTEAERMHRNARTFGKTFDPLPFGYMPAAEKQRKGDADILPLLPNIRHEKRKRNGKRNEKELVNQVLLNSWIRNSLALLVHLLHEVQEPKKRTGGAGTMQIITAAVIKGGTGKTTTAAALAQAAVKAGKKVLAIDLDPQANFTYFIGADQNRPGCYQLLTGTAAGELIQTTEQGIDAIAASPDLATITTAPGSAKRLQQALEPIKDSYHLAIIDTPPQMGELTYNALQASTGLIIPLETDNSSLQGLYQITDIAHQMSRSNPALSIIGVILTRYDSRPKINKYLQEVIETTGQEIGAPYLGAIRAGVAIREAQGLQKSLYEYAPKSNPAKDYLTLYKKVMRGSSTKKSTQEG